MLYRFGWDPGKARENLRKHRIDFVRAVEVFRDRFAISIFDEEHSDGQERWITIGKDSSGRTLVVIHTLSEVSAEECKIWIISARKAAKREARQYEEIDR